MRRYFPGFRWADVAVLTAMLALLAFFAVRDAEQVWRDAALPAALIVIYAIWSWRRR
jgi:hypothetical protein